MGQGLETNLDPYIIGTDFSYPFHIMNEAQDTSIDISGYALSWKVKRNLSDDDDDAVLTKTTGAGITISGSFNATPASNTQRATVTVADTDTDSIRPQDGCYWELKRTDAGLETRLAYGRVDLKRGVHRS